MKRMDYLDLTYELKALIVNDERYLSLLEKEKEMEADEEVMALSYQKDVKEVELSDLLKHLPGDSEEVKKARLELYHASSKLDEHPKVKGYLEAYKKLEELLNEINEILFSDLKDELPYAHCSR